MKYDRGLLLPPRKVHQPRIWLSSQPCSTQLITSCTLSVLLKLSQRRKQNLPSREVNQDCSALLHANISPGKEPSLSLLCGQIEEPPRLGSRSVPSQASRPRQRCRFLSELNSFFRRAFTASHLLLELNPHGSQFCSVALIQLNTIQGLLVLGWFPELQNSDKISPLTPGEEPRLGRVT